MAGAASRQVCLAFRLTPGPLPCQTRSAIDCVILRQPGDAAAGTTRFRRGWPPSRSMARSPCCRRTGPARPSFRWAAVAARGPRGGRLRPPDRARRAGAGRPPPAL